MSYFGNVSSFPCLEFTAPFSRNQAFFDGRNDFPLFPQSRISHFGHFAETFPILPGIPAIRTRPRPNAHVNGSQCALTWPPPGIPSGHNPFPNERSTSFLKIRSDVLLFLYLSLNASSSVITQSKRGKYFSSMR